MEYEVKLVFKKQVVGNDESEAVKEAIKLLKDDFDASNYLTSSLSVKKLDED